MNFGYTPDTPDYRRSRQRQLAAALAELVASPEFRVPTETAPYVEVDGLYRGVRVRHITGLTLAQQDELFRLADEIYDRVMAGA